MCIHKRAFMYTYTLFRRLYFCEIFKYNCISSTLSFDTIYIDIYRRRCHFINYANCAQNRDYPWIRLNGKSRWPIVDFAVLNVENLYKKHTNIILSFKFIYSDSVHFKIRGLTICEEN